MTMKNAKVVEWEAPIPAMCDIGGEPITETFIDGALQGGSWAILCLRCHGLYGVGLGSGRGQQYVKQSDGKWLKTG